MATTPERKALAASALASGLSVDEAAEAAKVHRTTLWKWEHEGDPEFGRLRETARAEIIAKGVRDAVAGIRRHAPKAVAKLAEALDAEGLVIDKDGAEHTYVAHGIRVRASKEILDRVPELGRRQQIQIGGTLEMRLVELDESDDPGESD